MKINTILIIILLILIFISLINDYKNIEGGPECIIYKKEKYKQWKKNNDRNVKNKRDDEKRRNRNQGKESDRQSKGATNNS